MQTTAGPVWIQLRCSRCGVRSFGTHIKANANTKKVVKKEVPVAAKRYAEERVNEVSADREAHGKKPLSVYLQMPIEPLFRVTRNRGSLTD